MGSHGWVDGSMDFWMGFETGMGSVGRRSSRGGVLGSMPTAVLRTVHHIYISQIFLRLWQPQLKIRIP